MNIIGNIKPVQSKIAKDSDILDLRGKNKHLQETFPANFPDRTFFFPLLAMVCTMR